RELDGQGILDVDLLRAHAPDLTSQPTVHSGFRGARSRSVEFGRACPGPARLSRHNGPMQSDAATVDQYLAELDDDRREVMTALVDTIDAHLPAGFDKAMYSGMPNWVVPLATYPDGYHCTPDTPLPFLAIASQKRHISIYHMSVYADPELLDWF